MGYARAGHVRAGIGGAVVAAIVVALTLAASTPAAAGGGDRLSPVRDRYEPGQQVTLVGYTEPVAVASTSTGDPLTDPDWQSPGPYDAYLRVDPAAERDIAAEDRPWPFVHPTDLRVGRVVAEESRGALSPQSLRVTVTFRLPDHVAPGDYAVTVCNEPCTRSLGWLFGSSVYVGVDPETPVVREWPLDDPAIRWLEDDALLFDPAGQGDNLDDWTITAAEVRAGNRAEPTAAPSVTTRQSGDTPIDPAVDESPAVRAADDPPGGISGEVIALLVGFGVLLVGWCAVWRLRPQDARIVVGEGGDPRSLGAVEDEAESERVRQAVIAGRWDDGHEVPHPAP